MNRTRAAHPGAWWLWAIALIVAASVTTNPLLLLLLAGVAIVTAVLRAAPSTPPNMLRFFITIALIVVVIRMMFGVLFGSGLGTTVLVTLPAVPLPSLLTGVHLGGPLTAESLFAGFVDGLRLATIILAVGAANVLAPASRLLKSAPAALYEVGVSLVVAMSFTPQLVSDLDRVRTARRLRGRDSRGVRAFAGSSIPVFEGALERSITLAAAMDARGYGRVGTRTRTQRVFSNAVVAAALTFAVLAISAVVSPLVPSVAAIGCAGAAVGCAAFALHLGAKHRVRTVYRPAAWSTTEWMVTCSAVATATCFVIGAFGDASGFTTSTDPLTWPTLPTLGIIGVAFAFLPLLVTKDVSR